MDVRWIKCTYGSRMGRVLFNWDRPTRTGVRDACLTDDNPAGAECMSFTLWGDTEAPRDRPRVGRVKFATRVLLGVWLGEIPRGAPGYCVNAVRCDDPELRWLGKAVVGRKAPPEAFLDKLCDALPAWAPLVEMVYLDEHLAPSREE